MIYVKYRNVEKFFISLFGCIRYPHLGDTCIFCHFLCLSVLIRQITVL